MTRRLSRRQRPPSSTSSSSSGYTVRSARWRHGRPRRYFTVPHSDWWVAGGWSLELEASTSTVTQTEVAAPSLSADFSGATRAAQSGSAILRAS